MRSNSIKTILNQFQKNNENRWYQNAIYKKEEEKTRYKNALLYFAQKQYTNVRQLLNLFHTEEYKTENVEILKLLSSAYMQDPSCTTSDKTTFAFPVLEKLYTHYINLPQPDYKNAVLSLSSMIACCTEYKTEAVKKYSQTALTILKDHKEAFITYDSKGKSNDNGLRSIYYSIYYRTGFNLALSANRVSVERRQIYDEAYHYFELALKEQPHHVLALLEWARVLITDQSIHVGLKKLFSYEAEFGKNKSYNESLIKIYQILKDDVKAAYYQKKSALITEQDQYSNIFDDLDGVEFPTDNSPLECIRAATWQHMHGHTDIAKKIILEVLTEHPGNIKALELLIILNTDEDKEQTLEVCEHLLKLNNNHMVALTKKAYLYTKDPENYQTAYDLYRKAFKLGNRHATTMHNLVFLSGKLNKPEEILEYCLANIEIKESPYHYFLLARAYFLTDDILSEIKTLHKIKILDQNYENRRVSFHMIEALFEIAQTIEDYKKCAKKLNSYFTRYPEEKENPGFKLMLETFKKYHIEISQIPSTEEKSISSVSSDVIPADIKIIIFNLLKKMHESTDLIADEKNEYNPIENDTHLYPLGDKKFRLFGFIASNARVNSVQEREAFEGVLASGQLKSKTSKGISCVKKLTTGRYSIKIRGYDRRMLTNGIFKISMPDGTPGDALALRFCPVKNHKKLNKFK